jgi:HD-like signal output (HDOD) protein
MNESIAKRIQDCHSLPTLPAAAIAVLQLAETSDTGIKDLAAVIAKDPALATKVLRVVNSSFYNLQQPVTSITQAAALLGLHSLRSLVLGFSLANSLRSQSGGFDHLDYWRRSMYAATAARLIASRVMPDQADNCFVAALLMDLGALLLDQLIGEQYAAVYGRAKTHTDLPILETHAFGMTHAEAGAVLAGHWKLPDALRIPIQSHHMPREVDSPDMRKICEVISLAGRCADVFVAPDSAGVIACVRRVCASVYKMDDDSADALLCEIGRKTAELAPLFDVQLNSASSYEGILERASEQLFEISLCEKSGTPAACLQDTGPAPAPDKAAVASRASDKRKTQRIRRDGNLQIIPCSRGTLGTPMKARLKDISTTGLGLVLSQRLEMLKQFIVELPQPDGRTKSLLYEVVRCDSSGGLTSIGSQLVSVLRPERHAARAENERRRAG